ncbi:hypothetical protein QQS21_006997 [Conoideocrella luteorostrata]|uniref:Aminoglycoside phosphotransferase domain-containing protein n=1 Tax=Conoideocrella luteorostrata TaxID=1105319 RepID=A0AAJ0CPH8_9HYPO|nr:hypothetical protein QQS21_006997 [Conoideocrella luteorostrata]
MDNAAKVPDASALQLLESLPQVLKPVRLQRSSEGGEHIVWIVNDSLVLRLPVEQTDTSTLLREKQLLDLIRKDGGIARLIPWCVGIGSWPSCRNWQYALYHKVEGISVEHAPEAVTNMTEDDLVAFMTSLKKAPVEEARKMGVPTGETVNDDQLIVAALGALRRLEANDQLQASALRKVKLVVPMNRHDLDTSTSTEQVLTHADLKGEHIFVGRDGRVTGIIDWSDAQIGCPSFDISGLAISVGARMAARVARRVGYSAGIVSRGLLMARSNSLVYLDEVMNAGSDYPEWLIRRQLERACEDVEAS